MDSRKSFSLSSIVANIVDDEGPIQVDLLLERIKELAGVSRIGSNIQSNFEKALRMAIREEKIERITDDKNFVYKAGAKYLHFRTPANGVERRLDQISKVEIRNAVEFLIKDQFGLAYDNALQGVKHVFGISRVDPEEGDRVKDLIDEMISSNVIIRHGPLLHLVVS